MQPEPEESVDERMAKAFENELQKYDLQIKIIRQNLCAQENVVRALTEANARYATTRRTVADLVEAREAMIEGLVASYRAYEDLLEKAAEGLEFYTKLDSNIKKLLEKSR
jgi:tyrosine-protein phosphatase non-receptor type 23